MTRNILLLGEKAIDSWLVGKCPKIAPEAPVPVFWPMHTHTNPGMAANVLANLNSLAPDWHVDFFHQSNPIFKTRLVDTQSGQQIVRVDIGDETVGRINLDDLFKHIESRGPSFYSAVVISEYKGFLSTEDIAAVAAWAKKNNVPIFCDTKHIIEESWAKDITVIKINRKEADAHGCEPYPYCENIIVTEGPKGCYLDQRISPGALHRVPVKPVEVRSVAGCGDSMMAGLVVSYLEQGDEPVVVTDGWRPHIIQRNRLIRAMAFANKVARVAASKPGVVAVKREEVE